MDNLERAKSLFDDAWNSFDGAWALVEESHDTAVFGLEAYAEYYFLWALKTTSELIDAGHKPKLLGGEGSAEELTKENAEGYARAWAERLMGRRVPVREALHIVLAHAIFEALVIELGLTVVVLLPEGFLKTRFGTRTLSIEEAEAGWQEAVRSRLATEVRETMTLAKRIQFVMAAAEAIDSSEKDRICSVYKPDLEAVRAIDTRRQDVLHSVQIDDNYDSTDDRKTLELTARCLGHLVANCALGLGLSRLYPQMAATGSDIVAGPGFERDAPQPTWKDLVQLVKEID